MNWLPTILLLGAAFLAVFWQAAFGGVRFLLGAQVDLLPPLMVYASLYGSITTVTLLALCGGLWFDSLSANPLGVSVLPLFRRSAREGRPPRASIRAVVEAPRARDPRRPDRTRKGSVSSSRRRTAPPLPGERRR